MTVDIYPDAQRARVAGTLTFANRGDAPIRDLYLVYPRSARVQTLEFSVPAKLALSVPEMRWHHYVLDAPLEPGATAGLRFDLEYGARGFRNEGADPTVLANGTFSQSGAHTRDVADPGVRLRRRRGTRVRQRPQEVRPGAAAADARPRRPGPAPAERALARRRFHRVPGDGVHGRRPVAGDVGLRRARLDRERSPLHRVPDGFADGGDLSVRVRAIRGAPGHVAGSGRRRRDRDRLSRGARVQPRPHGGRRQGFAVLLHAALRALPAPDRADHRVPALFAQRRVRRVVPQHGSVQRGDRLHRQRGRRRPEGRRLPVFRHRARSGAPMVGAPGGAGQRAGRGVHHREPCRVLRADGAESQVRRRENAPVPPLRARPLSQRPRRRAEGRAAAAARRRRRVRALPEGGARPLRAAGRDRREGDGRRAVGIRRALAVQGAAVRDVARSHRRIAARDAAGAPGAHRGLPRDDHALRQSRGECGHACTRRWRLRCRSRRAGAQDPRRRRRQRAGCRAGHAGGHRRAGCEGRPAVPREASREDRREPVHRHGVRRAREGGHRSRSTSSSTATPTTTCPSWRSHDAQRRGADAARRGPRASLLGGRGGRDDAACRHRTRRSRPRTRVMAPAVSPPT